jgi:hypothetical protein
MNNACNGQGGVYTVPCILSQKYSEIRYVTDVSDMFLCTWEHWVSSVNVLRHAGGYLQGYSGGEVGPAAG